MKPNAIVYTSNTGYTAAYARLLGQKTGLPVYALAEADKTLPKQTVIIYLGWLMAGKVKGYAAASKQFAVAAVCGVGLGETGSQLDSVRTANQLASDAVLFTLQGGMDRNKLRGVNKFMIGMLMKALSAKKERSADEEKMLALMQKGGNYVSEQNLADVLAWYQQQ
ncbi:MAG: hypothetical protein ACI4RK_08240 [Oscillospiraceae bacterium]